MLCTEKPIRWLHGSNELLRHRFRASGTRNQVSSNFSHFLFRAFFLLECPNKLSIYTSKMAVSLGPDSNRPIISGPSSWFNPTTKRRSASIAAKTTKHTDILAAHEQALPDPSPPLESRRPNEKRESNAHHLWRSRDNRKGQCLIP